MKYDFLGPLLAGAVLLALAGCDSPESRVAGVCKDKGYESKVCDCVVKTIKDTGKLDWTGEKIENAAVRATIFATAAGCKLAQ